MHVQVAVVGGGLAGLVAASRLHKAGVDFRLFEARDRLGGRILSADIRGVPSNDGFDVGPSWFWPDMQPDFEEFVRALGLSIFPQHEEGDVIIDRYALDAPRRFRPMRQESSSMRLAGGTGTLVSALAASLPPSRLSLNNCVTHLAIVAGGVALTMRAGNGSVQTIMAAQVVVAVPPRLVAGGIRFEPAPDHAALAKWQGTPTWMAPHAKFFALYDSPFWREEGLSGDAQSYLGPLVEIHDATTASGQAALFGFVGLDATRRETIGEKALAELAVAQLVRLFGPKAAEPLGTLCKDWSVDALTATAADRLSSGHPGASPGAWLGGAWEEFVILASSETSLVAPGYLAGAVDAGSRAAAGVISRLQTKPAETAAC
jgi:monoamine oxidase